MLNYLPIAVPFAGGVDTKSDPKRLTPGKLKTLKNGEFTRGATVKGRAGYLATDTRGYKGEVLQGTPKAVGAFDDQLLLATNRYLYTYSQNNNRYSGQGFYHPITHRVLGTIASNEEQQGGEVGTAGGVTVYAWSSPGGKVKISVRDADTGGSLTDTTSGTLTNLGAEYTVASSNADWPRVVVINSIIMVLYVDTSSDNLKGLPIKPWDVVASATATPVTITSDLSTTSNAYAVAATTEDYALLVWDTDDTVEAGMRVAHLHADGTLTLTHNDFTGSSTHTEAGLAISYDGTSGKAFITMWDSGTTTLTTVKINGSDLVEELSATVVIAAVVRVANAIHVTDASQSSVRGVAVAYSTSAADAWNYQTVVKEYLDTLATPNTYTIRHSMIVGGGFSDGTTGFITLCHISQSGLQNHYYLYAGNGELCGCMLPRQGPDAVAATSIHVYTPRAVGTKHQALFMFARQLDAHTDDIAVFQHRGLKLVEFDPAATPVITEAGAGGYLSGSQLWYTDGSGPVVEQGFHMFPDVINTSITDASNSAAFAVGMVFNYRVYYVWQSLVTGEIFRSAAIVRTITIDQATSEVTIVIPTLTHTQKTGVWIEVYRTEDAAADIYYKVTGYDPSDTTGPNCWVNNNTAADTVSFVDGLADATLISQQIDYLTAGEVPNFPPPGPEFIRSVGDRIFCVGGGIEDNQIFFSKPRLDGVGTEFALTHVTSDSPDEGGRLLSISYINETPVFFKERSVFTLTGPGLDALGSGEYIAEQISADVGIQNPNAVVSCPFGVMFHSNKGIYLLDTQPAVSYIGAEVESFNALDFVSAQIIPDTNTVIFLASDGDALIFDYYYKQWGTFTNHRAKSGVVFQGNQFAYLRSADDQVYIRDTTLFTDAGAPYSLVVRTAPIRPLIPTVQRFFKMNKFELLGEFLSSHTLKCRLYYNRELTPFQEFTFDPSTVIDTMTWGQTGVTWGQSGILWGGKINPMEYQFEKRPKRMKAQSISFEFEAIPGDVPGASFELSEILMSVAEYPNPGLARIAAGRKL